MSYPPVQFFNPSFSSLPPNPNPNSTSNLFKSQFQNPQPQNLDIRSTSDLSTTLSSLNSLIDQTHQILQSFSSLIPLQYSDCNKSNGLMACPFNPHHLMQPDYLFAHSLRCPSSPYPVIEEPLPPLYYRKTLKSSTDSHNENDFVQTLHGSDAELCFSLDHYFAGFRSNFFYHDCPGAVNFSAFDGASRTFTLPVILSVQCANFVCNEDRELKSFEKKCWRVVPSDFWAIRTEIEAWNECPAMYSYRVLYALPGLDMIRECDLARWVVGNSPRYSIVIDVEMGDHISLLCRLCLKAFMSDACTTLNNLDKKVVAGSKSFHCPVLVQAFKWLSSQLSILYGEINGKLFALNILKHCILDAASGLLIFPLEQKAIESPSSGESFQRHDAGGNAIGSFDNQALFQRNANGKHNSTVGESLISKAIFVSQVAASIAALHERSFLEEKIRGRHLFRSLTNYQRVAEHEYLSQRAEEERKRHPHYTPIIEHDGLPRQQSSTQGNNKPKTREELLAEERDYKRRRMSYRGKKVKRNTLEVMRNIIEDYMDEIKQAGGIGCFQKGTVEERTHPSEPCDAFGITMDVGKSRISNREASTARDSPDHHRKQSHSGYRSTSFRDEQPRGDPYSNHEHVEVHKGDGKGKCDKKYYSRSPEKDQRHERSHERVHHRRERDEPHEIKRSCSIMSKYHNRRSSSMRNAHHDEKVKSRQKTDTYRSQSSGSSVNNFEDRYDPSESH